MRSLKLSGSEGGIQVVQGLSAELTAAPAGLLFIQLSQTGCSGRFAELANILCVSADVGSVPHAAYFRKTQ